MRYIAILSAVLLLGSCLTIRPTQEKISVDLRGTKLTAGSAEAQFDKFLSIGGLKKGNIDVFYYPEDDVICLQFRSDMITYYQYWDKRNRDAFVSGLRMYKEDYQQRTLINKNSKTKMAYGKVQGYVIWETTRFSAQGRGYPNIEIGYYFKNRAPYFSINQRETDNENARQEDGLRAKSVNMTVFFTRAQAENLVLLFDQEYLQGLRSTVPAGRTETEAEADVY